jgi:hypothetical protein
MKKELVLFALLFSLTRGLGGCARSSFAFSPTADVTNTLSISA